MSGVAIVRSKSILPCSICAARSSAPTMSAPAARASSAAAPVANTATRTSLPVPDGRATVPRTIWSALRGSTPRRNGDVDVLVELGGRHLLDEAERLGGGVEAVAIELLRRVGELLTGHVCVSLVWV